MSNIPERNRREFLAASAGMLVAGPAGIAAAARAVAGTITATPRALTFGMVTYLWGRDLSLQELLVACEASGLEGVELRTTHRHGVERDLSADARREIRKRFADSPVAMVGIGSDERFDSPDPARLAAAKRSTRDFLELSSSVGGSGVKVKPDSFHRGVDQATTIRQIGRSLAELAPMAADLGQELRLEVHGQCADPGHIRRIVEIADHPSVRVCWNSNARDLRGEGLQRNYQRLRPYFGGTLHVRELGDERYPYVDLIELLVRDRYAGMVLLEAHSSPPRHRVPALANQRAVMDEMSRRATVVVGDAPVPVVIAARRRAPRQFDVRAGDELFGTVRLGSGDRTPVVFPLNAPGGRLAVRAFPFERRAGESDDHPHHRGLWFAHGDVDGHDFWHDENCRVVVRNAVVEGSSLRFDADWMAGGRRVAVESRTMRFAATPSRRRIDVDIELKPVAETMILGDTKEGAFALRLAPTLRVDGPQALGRLENAEGMLDGDCWGRRSKSIVAEGPVDGRLVRVRMTDAGGNPRHPTWWHARKYGLLAANPFGRRAFEGGGTSGAMTITKESPLRLRYAVELGTGLDSASVDS
ncbi:MAG: PmoA family protein [Phycisphaerales bacterium]|nr:PmoA family protein [Phycisphaerales bacterium]